MIGCIVTIILGLIWLGYESDYMRVRLPVGKAIEVKEGIMIEPIGELRATCDQPYLMKVIKLARKETITLTDEDKSKEVKVKTLRIGDGVYNGLILQRLISYIPKEASITLTNMPSRAENCVTTKHGVPTAQLQCSWAYNGSKGSWYLLSGYGIGIYCFDSPTNRIRKCFNCLCPDDIAQLPNEWVLATTIPVFAYAIEQQKAVEETTRYLDSIKREVKA